MKKAILVFCSGLILVSCKKEKSPVCCLPPASQEKIYYEGSNIAYGAPGWEEIFSMNPDGTGQKQLTNFSGDGANAKATSTPALSPDGRKVYFVSDRDTPSGEFFSMNPDGTDIIKLISNGIAGSKMRDPFIFQNGQKVVYCMELGSGASRHGEIFTANINGSNIQSLISYPAEGNCYHPCVNPANTTIVYANLIGGRIELYAMNTDGTNKRALTSSGPAVKWHAQFSPDGTRIVFDASVGSGAEIFIMNADGTGMTQLTDYTRAGTINNFTWGPTFSKDGQVIYFASDEYNGITSQLYKMNADGSSKVRLTSSAEDKYNPCIK
ncbi:MAG: PD40 domain-containing protein [Chitinophagaceae bacterium]|nr:PD40 domain-containing protein [Chitinophagaceae bacterium]